MTEKTLYLIRERRYPESFHKRKLLGLFGKQKTQFERPWELLRDGRPVGFYRTREEAASAAKDIEGAIE